MEIRQYEIIKRRERFVSGLQKGQPARMDDSPKREDFHWSILAGGASERPSE